MKIEIRQKYIETQVYRWQCYQALETVLNQIANDERIGLPASEINKLYAENLRERIAQYEAELKEYEESHEDVPGKELKCS